MEFLFFWFLPPPGFWIYRPRFDLVHKCVMVKENLVRIRFTIDEPDTNSRLTSLFWWISHDLTHSLRTAAPPSSILLTGEFTWLRDRKSVNQLLLCTVAHTFLPRNCTDSPFTRDLVVVLPPAEGVYTIVLQSTNSKGIYGTFTSPPIHYFPVRVERQLSFGTRFTLKPIQ